LNDTSYNNLLEIIAVKGKFDVINHNVPSGVFNYRSTICNLKIKNESI